MDDFERRRRSLEGSRFLIRAELAVAFAAPIVVGFLYLASPGGGTPMFGRLWLVEVVPWAGLIGFIVGIAWIVRLSRPDPERGERSWRYRDF